MGNMNKGPDLGVQLPRHMSPKSKEKLVQEPRGKWRKEWESDTR